ncbi:alanine racemase [Frondihabitans australicus]|uniref:Alanine racemase n=1 Tax=Frondihabitans australicus TaxID=386892 RepID=A0A495IHP1_9MICO|nr:alanine racemase [Frondihabitans australicus]RKR75474.1 alanine racemase [Frondihabitans australicus]
MNASAETPAAAAAAAASTTETAWLRRATIDLGAYRANLAHLQEVVAPAALMAVVKANAYGHGAVPMARAAVTAGVRWLGVLELANAHELRAAGLSPDREPGDDGVALFAWQFAPTETFERAISERVDLGISTLGQLEAVAAAVESSTRAAAPDAGPDAQVPVELQALVHLNVDTGLHRDGAAPEDWDALVERAVALAAAGVVRLRGVYSHLAEASDDEDTDSAVALTEAVERAAALGAVFERRHLTASSAGLERPELRLDMVRMGANTYGIPVTDGLTAADRGLVPVMTLSARVARVKRIAAGTGVSYDYTWRAPRDTTVALVPIGYADGISRRSQLGVGPDGTPGEGAGGASVALGGKRYPIVGRVAMDQFLVDVGDDEVAVGDEVTLFGTGDHGELTVGEWADLIGTIGEEITCSMGPRVERVYVS